MPAPEHKATPVPSDPRLTRYARMRREEMPGRMVGFSGTSRKPLPKAQGRALRVVLDGLKGDGIRWLGTGMAQHGDAQANTLARRLGYATRGYPMTGNPHPPLFFVDWKQEAKPPLERDEDIAIDCDVLVACPRGPESTLPRSGTWATIRRARKWKRRIIIVWPDGSLTEEG